MNSSVDWSKPQPLGQYRHLYRQMALPTSISPSRSGKTHFFNDIFVDALPAGQFSASPGGQTQPREDDNMYTQLWRCGNCGWGTFEHDHPRKLMSGQLRNGLGELIDICEECINFLQTAPKYELDPKIANPTRKVSK